MTLVRDTVSAIAWQMVSLVCPNNFVMDHLIVTRRNLNSSQIRNSRRLKRDETLIDAKTLHAITLSEEVSDYRTR